MKPVYVSAIVPLLLVVSPTQGAQHIVVTGRVTSTQAAPIMGAQVRSPDAGVGVGTDDAGRFRMTLSASLRGREIVLNVRAIGFRPESRSVRLMGDTTTANFSLQVDVNRLSEVIVTGVTGATETKRLPFTVDRSAPGTAAAPPSGSPPPRARGDASSFAPTHGELRHFNTESYGRINDNAFLGARDNPLSTFSIDVDRASYSNVRRFVTVGQLPPRDAVRIEELINYFSYDYPDPRDRHPFSVTTEVARAPWATSHYLVRVGLQAQRLDRSMIPPSNLVFLIDVSGSMQPENKLPLVKQAFRLLVSQLREEDRVAIVVYAGAAGLVLPSTSGDRKEDILTALGRLEAGGSTAGGAGLRLAYDIARHHHIADGNNRVILATDGDFNVGASSDADMERLIEEKRKQGTFLSVLGFGRGNLKDSKMETLADKGNGNYAYIDNIVEARKVFVDEMAGTLLTLAKDVKLQVEFNPELVASYRLIGYENRLLAREDFDDDTKDAGEIGAGHSVTALYEVVPVRARSADDVRTTEPLRYQTPARTSARSRSNELMYIKLRYKLPDARTSRWFDHTVLATERRRASDDFRFAASVAAFGMILRDSEHRGTATIDNVIEMARGALGEDPGGYRAEFVRMAEAVRDRSLVTVRER
ncbi:MAG TPA: von Willebrand factor type A domain-containing protein [Gemmatimonadaceae bacterium]